MRGKGQANITIQSASISTVTELFIMGAAHTMHSVACSCDWDMWLESFKHILLGLNAQAHSATI